MKCLAMKCHAALIMFGILLLLAACGDGARQKTTKATPQSEAQRQAQLNQQLIQLQQQVTQLNEQINLLQLESQQRFGALLQQGTALSAQVVVMQQALQSDGKAPVLPAVEQQTVEKPATGPAQPGAPVRVATEQTKEDGNNVVQMLVRLIALLIVLGAVWFMFKIFIGRWGDDEEDDEELLADSDDLAAEAPEEEIVTEEGTIYVSPAAQSDDVQAHPDETPVEATDETVTEAEKRDDESPKP